MKFDRPSLKTCLIGMTVGICVAVLPYTGLPPFGGQPPGRVMSAGHASATPKTRAEQSVKQGWIGNLISGGDKNVCMKVDLKVGEFVPSNNFIVDTLKLHTDWTVFSDEEDESCKPNAFATVFIQSFSSTRSVGFNAYGTTEGYAGAASVVLPGVSKHPLLVVATSGTAEDVSKMLVDQIAPVISGGAGVDVGELADSGNYTLPKEDEITCISINAASNGARESIAQSISWARPKWYIRDFNNAENCDPDYYFAYYQKSLEGGFGREGYFTAVTARKANDMVPLIAVASARDENSSHNKALNNLLPYVQ